MKKLWVLLALAGVLLCGCVPEPVENPPETTTQATTVETTVETTVAEKITVYEGAIEYFLGEITDYSWEQEFPPEYVMIHFCSAVVNHRDDPYNHEYVRQTFTDAGVSIHYIIDREGQIFCYIPEDRSAWHAGYGTWLNDEKYTNKMNKYSIGIELMGMGTYEEMSGYLHKWEYNKIPKEHLGYTDAQYVSLKALVEDICQRHDIPLDKDHIIGHEEFSPKKNDPGDLFDWSRIIPSMGVLTVETEFTTNDGLQIKATNKSQKEIDSAIVYTLWYDANGLPVDVGGTIADNATKEVLTEIGVGEIAEFTIPTEVGTAQAKQAVAAVYFTDGTTWENENISQWVNANLNTAE